MDQFRDIKRMANQIATAFQAYPEDQAINETANHIKSFWDPRMRKQLAEIMERRLREMRVDAETGRIALRHASGPEPARD